MIEIKNNIYWTGIRDWGLNVFHGHELSTYRGTSYNSYLIKDKKTVLVDTVWDPYKEKFVEDLEREVGLKNIDAIVINHVEPDHGGSLGLLMDKIPNTPIYCTKAGSEIMKKVFGENNWNFVTVKTGDTLETGDYTLRFVEMTMIHWPDSMLTYVDGAKLALSNDAFGQHYCSTSIYNDEVDRAELFEEALKYFVNILGPFRPLIKKKIEEIRKMNIEIDMIAPSHGVIWRNNPLEIIEKYYEWTNLDYNEGWVAIAYDTMYNSNRLMAEAMGRGFEKAGIAYKIINVATKDKSDLNVDLMRAKGIILGCCTVNNAVTRPIAALLDEIKALRIKNKYAGSFGSFGWSGEAPKIISEKLKEAGSKVIMEPISVKYKPTYDEYVKCEEYAIEFARKMKEEA